MRLCARIFRALIVGRSRAAAREIEGIATTSYRRNGNAGTGGHEERCGPSSIVGKTDQPRRFSPPPRHSTTIDEREAADADLSHIQRRTPGVDALLGRFPGRC